MTIRLFDRDVELRAFSAQVLACNPRGERWEVLLDQTAFYPEGGGQGADHGVLGGAKVLDVHERDGLILHLTDAPLTPGDIVSGEIDWQRRFSMMQQHTGEHILSGLICHRYGYHNVGFHIGTEAVTLDFSGPLSEEQAREAERLANEVIWQDIPVEAWIPDPRELAALDYRSKKELTGDVRIVRIAGADTCACCGTHVRTTGQVGQIKLMGMMNYKGGVRLSILCGARALAAENALLDENRAVSRALSAKPGELAAAVTHALRERDDLRWRSEQLGMQLFLMQAKAQQQEAVRVVMGDMLAPSQLRKAAGKLCEGARVGLAAIPRGEGWSFALSSATEDVRPLAQRLTARFGGKAGGPRDMVQGVLERGAAQDIAAELRA